MPVALQSSDCDSLAQLLWPAQILQDVSEEHARKTITVDPFPHTAVRAASIHPCKHAAVMQKLGALAESGGKPFQVERRARKPCCRPCSNLPN